MERLRRIFAWSDPAILSRWRKVVAWSELAGGVAGFLFFAAAPFVAPRMLPVARAGLLNRYGAALLFFLLSALAGWRLLRGRRSARDLALSWVVLVPQVLWLYLPGGSYRAVAGLALAPSWTTGRGWDVVFGGTVAFRLAQPEVAPGIGAGVNFWILLALAVLFASRREERRQARDAR